MNKLEKILKNKVGSFIRINYTLENNEQESVQGFLEEITDDYIVLNSPLKIYLNRKTATITNFFEHPEVMKKE